MFDLKLGFDKTILVTSLGRFRHLFDLNNISDAHLICVGNHILRLVEIVLEILPVKMLADDSTLREVMHDIRLKAAHNDVHGFRFCYLVSELFVFVGDIVIRVIPIAVHTLIIAIRRSLFGFLSGLFLRRLLLLLGLLRCYDFFESAKALLILRSSLPDWFLIINLVADRPDNIRALLNPILVEVGPMLAHDPHTVVTTCKIIASVNEIACCVSFVLVTD